jgi:hypothetical protein
LPERGSGVGPEKGVAGDDATCEPNEPLIRRFAPFSRKGRRDRVLQGGKEALGNISVFAL